MNEHKHHMLTIITIEKFSTVTILRDQMESGLIYFRYHMGISSLHHVVKGTDNVNCVINETDVKRV